MSFDIHAALFALTVAVPTFLGVALIFLFAATEGGADKYFVGAMTLSGAVVGVLAFVLGGLA